MMGIFSIYTGLLYNEMFSVALNICGSNWYIPSTPLVAPNATATADIASNYLPIDTSRTYEFGVDPSWNGVPNSLNYYNSLKMKLSIIIGVTHMVLGICMSALNGIHFKHYVDIWFEFLPQLVFMLSLFGYMVFLIIYKWSVPASHWIEADISAPFLLNVMIQMFLSPVQVVPENKLYEGQHAVQVVLLLLAVISVPIMLLVKPLYLRNKHNASLKRIPTSIVDEHSHDGHGEEEFDFSEIFVKQCIHTIEYVLGAISNTASYLRLWALSLAHSELSIVFWERVFIALYTYGESGVALQAIFAFCGFAGWAGATFGVLLVMESLSAFLHALRLHWVEFQNKFYKGDGQLFLPFSYERILSGEEE